MERFEERSVIVPLRLRRAKRYRALVAENSEGTLSSLNLQRYPLSLFIIPNTIRGFPWRSNIGFALEIPISRSSLELIPDG